MRYTFKKIERLSSKKEIELLFTKGESFVAYPFKVIFKKVADSQGLPAKVLISVSKKNFKSAVKRNKIKRHIRESYRKNKSIIWDKYDETTNEQLLIGFIYIGKSIVTSTEFDQKLILILHRLIEKDVKDNR